MSGNRNKKTHRIWSMLVRFIGRGVHFAPFSLLHHPNNGPKRIRYFSFPTMQAA